MFRPLWPSYKNLKKSVAAVILPPRIFLYFGAPDHDRKRPQHVVYNLMIDGIFIHFTLLVSYVFGCFDAFQLWKNY
jgi:hypothetical protein